MNFLANENFPFPSVKLLRNSNFYVKYIAEEHPGITDLEVIRMATDENLIILTFDKDYGEIIFKSSIKTPPPVVFFRYKGENQTFAGEYILNITIEQRHLLAKAFTVIEENNYRQRLYKY